MAIQSADPTDTALDVVSGNLKSHARNRLVVDAPQRYRRMENVHGYLIHAPISQQRMHYDSSSATVHYKVSPQPPVGSMSQFVPLCQDAICQYPCTLYHVFSFTHHLSIGVHLNMRFIGLLPTSIIKWFHPSIELAGLLSLKQAAVAARFGGDDHALNTICAPKDGTCS